MLTPLTNSTADVAVAERTDEVTVNTTASDFTLIVNTQPAVHSWKRLPSLLPEPASRQ